VLLNARLHHWG